MLFRSKLFVNQTGNTTYSGQVTGSGTLFVTGTAQGNTLTLNTANNPFSGSIVVQGAQLALANGSMISPIASSNFASVADVSIRNGGGLNIDNSGAYPANRLNDAAPITLRNTGPSLTVATVGLNYTSDQASLIAPRVENVGAVTLAGGANTIRVNASANGALATLNLASLTRSAGSTLVVLGSSMEDPLADRRGDLSVTNATNLLSALVGGGSLTSGTPNISILPWATGSLSGVNATATGSLGNTFVTYSVLPGFGNGFREIGRAHV